MQASRLAATRKGTPTMQTQSTTSARTCLLCPKPQKARGWCEAHYSRWQRYGSPTAPNPWGTLGERFWRKANRGLPSECWRWKGHKTPTGYGRYVGEGAHRVAYRLLLGPIPVGMTIDHLCRVRDCVNPAHMELVSLRVNVLRGIGPPAQNAKRSHCKRGHSFDAANTYLYRGSRACRSCRRLRKIHSRLS